MTSAPEDTLPDEWFYLDEIGELCECSSQPLRHIPGFENCQGKLSDDRGPYCSECGAQNDGAVIDCGIGYTEYWGRPGYDTDKRYLSTCCERELFERRDMKQEYERDQHTRRHAG